METWMGYDSLGGTSAESEEDFIQNGGYYEDMVGVALENLNIAINKDITAFYSAVAEHASDEEVVALKKDFPDLNVIK